MSLEQRPCPVCRSLDGEALHDQTYALFDDSALPSHTQLTACGQCGLVYARSNATAADYRRHYAQYSKYDTAQQASGSGDSPLDHVRIEKLVDDLTHQLSKTAAVLDIGAGRGGVLSAFQNRGYDQLYALDPAAGCVTAMQAKGLQADVCDLESELWPSDPRCFDLIIFSHVLEHVFDVSAAIAKAKKRLNPNGRIYIEVPDARGYSAEGFPPYYFFDPEHINHFDREALCCLAAVAGLSVLKIVDRELDVGGPSPYPAVAIWLGLHAPSVTLQVETPHASTQNSIRSYLQDCAVVLDQLPANAALKQLIQSQQPVVLWGAGSHAQRMLANSLLSQTNVIAAIDNDPGKQGRFLKKIEVVSALLGYQLARKNQACIAVAVAIGADTLIQSIKAIEPELPLISV